LNWFWDIRSRDGGMNGLEFARCLTAGNLTRVLMHAAPARVSIEVRADDGQLVARGDVDRDGEYTPITLVTLDAGSVARQELWPTDDHIGLPVLLPGGEVGVLTAWHNDDDRSWWQWSVEFSNHTARPADWAPPNSRLQR
jgi:hypothetical protein